MLEVQIKEICDTCGQFIHTQHVILRISDWVAKPEKLNTVNIKKPHHKDGVTRHACDLCLQGGVSL